MCFTLCMCVSVCLSAVCISIYIMYIYNLIHPSIQPSISVSHPSIHPSIHLSIYHFFWQPEVLLDIDISKPSLYYVIYRYINRNDNSVTGEVTLTPMTSTDTEQTSSVTFAPSRDPAFSNVGQSGVSMAFVLNPGKWTVSTNVPDTVFLVSAHLLIVCRLNY